MTVSFIPKEVLSVVARDVERFLEPAINLSGGRDSMSSVWKSLLADQSQLWMAFEDEDNKPKGALVTRIEQYPLKKMINYLYIGGDDLKEWHQDMLAIVEKFAREKDCQGMELVGRKGWDRFLKECGWKAKHIICERFFDEEEAEQEKLNVA
jgi:spore cortex formation protein SpoVR/YcgB (stage V sporulation)|tara:strand:- start:739 stop:1194 length:456 start_codon:yes stop_codon:yes gene_type:complete